MAEIRTIYEESHEIYGAPQNSCKDVSERRQGKQEDRGEVYERDGDPGMLSETQDPHNKGF